MIQNVGTWDAYMRITGGLIGLSYGIRRIIRKNDAMGALLVMASAMKVAEGVTRVCPMLYSMGISTTEKQQMNVTPSTPHSFPASSETPV